jgi:hypothetical protein
MKLAIIGSRGFNDKKLLEDILNPLVFNISLIISGGAIGADKIGEEWAEKYGIETLIFLPDWKQHGKAAGFIRNEDIIKNADQVIAFWDEKSKGTKHSISLCEKYNKPCRIINYGNK